MAARRALKTVPQAAPKPVARDLREVIAEAVAAMPWLEASDRALVDLALHAARQIEEAQERRDLLDELFAETDPRDVSTFKKLQKLEAMCDVTKSVGWLGPQIQGYMRDLGGTPPSRKTLQPDSPVKSKLAELREQAAQRPTPKTPGA